MCESIGTYKISPDVRRAIEQGFRESGLTLLFKDRKPMVTLDAHFKALAPKVRELPSWVGETFLPIRPGHQIIVRILGGTHGQAHAAG